MGGWLIPESMASRCFISRTGTGSKSPNKECRGGDGGLAGKSETKQNYSFSMQIANFL